jgi:ABC-type uncharacterized transport system permease subunit
VLIWNTPVPQLSKSGFIPGFRDYSGEATCRRETAGEAYDWLYWNFMQEMSVFWLRAAVALYAIGLFHTIQVAIRKGSSIFRPAIAAFCVAVVLHMVALVEAAFTVHHFPAGGFHNTVSLFAFLIAVTFLLVYWRYRFESLAVFLFPMVFVMTAVAAMETPVGAWTNRTARDTWLLVHIILVLLGYAALLLTALASVFYLVQERHIKRKRSMALLERLPPLGILDTLISQSMGFGFVLITLGLVTGGTWAFIESGTRWLDNPRIAISFVTWCFTLVMVFLRVTAGWRGRKAALMSLTVVACLAATWITHLGLRSLLVQ